MVFLSASISNRENAIGIFFEKFGDEKTKDLYNQVMNCLKKMTRRLESSEKGSLTRKSVRKQLKLNGLLSLKQKFLIARL